MEPFAEFVMSPWGGALFIGLIGMFLLEPVGRRIYFWWQGRKRH